MNKYIIIFLMLLLPTISLAVTLEGETYNGYTYEAKSLAAPFAISNNLDDMAFVKCDESEFNNDVYANTQGGAGYSFYQIDLINDKLIRNQSFPTTTQDTRRFLEWIDCYNDVSYFVNDPTTNPITIHSKTLSTLGVISSYTLSSSSSPIYGVSFAKINNDNHYFSDYNKLIKTDSDGLLGIIIERTLDGPIIDIVTDNSFLYVLTNTSLYKYDTDLIEQERTSTSEVQVGKYPTIKRDHYMYYNNFFKHIFIVKNSTTITAFDPNNFVVKYQSTLTYPIFDASSNMGDIQFTSKSFYYNSYIVGVIDGMLACQYETGDCELQFNASQFDGWNTFYSRESVDTGFSRNRAGVLVNGHYIFPRSYPYIGIVSGFDIEYEFNDVFSITNMEVNKTPNLVNTDINITLNGEHFEGDEYLLYGLSCDGNNEKLFSSVFNDNTELLNNSQFSIHCDNSEILPDSFGLDEYTIRLGKCTIGDYFHIQNKLISGLFSVNFDIGVVDGHTSIIHLLGAEHVFTEVGTDIELIDDMIAEINIEYDESSSVLTISDTHTGTILISKHYDLSLTPYIYTDRLYVSISIMVDMTGEIYKVGVKNYGELSYTYSEDYNLTFEIDNHFIETEIVNYNDGVKDLNEDISDTNYYLIENDISYLNDTEVHEITPNVCKYIQRISGTPILRDVMILNTSSGESLQYGDNYSVTSAYSWICSNDYNSRSAVYPNETIYSLEYFGFQCINCDATNKMRVGVDTTSPSGTSYTSIDYNTTKNPYTNDLMINVSKAINYETRENITGLTNLYGLKIQELNLVNDENFNEIGNIEVTKNYLPQLTSENSKICSYKTPGVYTVTGYLSSLIDKNYNTVITRTIEIVPTEPSDIGGAFDPVLESDDFTASFWKFIMFLSFTIMIFVGAGLFNSENKRLDIIWIEGLLGETVMLFIMCKVFSFFPMYYFILDLFLVAGTIVYYIKKVFN